MNISFYKNLPSFSNFDKVVEKHRYQPLPEDWFIGVTDVVNSTIAIAEGRYKMVNMAGASVISAVTNELGEDPFPFVFGGDGAGFAIPGAERERIAEVLAACQIWSSEELGLSLRVALVPVSNIRQAGHDVTVARFQASTEIGYAMFSGGGLAWAEAQMKADNYMVAPAAPGTRPDLTGLSCRFRPLKARNGHIVSLLVLPVDGAETAPFAALLGDILDTLERAAGRQGHPVAPEGPRFVWPPQGLAIETKTPGTNQQGRSRLSIMMEHLIPWVLQATRTRIKRFDPAAYRRDTTANTDFRKYDDGLKLTVDCTTETIEELERLLVAAQSAGIAQYGLHRQENALMTCIVPSPFTRDHMHFVDGAAGGYTKAAEMLKAKRKNG